ncbi:hypothetical protein UA38_12065 [Photobacterium kishitanii]|uniref:Uncharacterized protein n=1 Tax=Photobacterium kishitanii TaxID=318456 RepID=A0AAX0YVW7_9GAMM|nr:hypothetical protein UA38_12065 [Photobacterium kishitanii]KJG60627.1 hypothetical protein UA42_14865 [Photobacterium kishitanii]KJG64930.1 hypothetical protein UA40_14565 [Photobacterium kishitanii]PSX30778.1 hypothetical protein C0W39_19735 [Photobacterium kishitanii]PSX43996.1 hypothetical protein C0W53_15300 [Photobacterium kishitanii]
MKIITSKNGKIDIVLAVASLVVTSILLIWFPTFFDSNMNTIIISCATMILLLNAIIELLCSLDNN